MSGLGEGFADGALRFSRVRGRMGNDYSLQYPSPFFDVAQTYLPATIKQMFRWCRYYFLVNPLINAVVSKMAEYPVTDIILDADDESNKDLWRHMLLEHLRYRAFQVETGLDYYAYGNAMVSIYFPFVKMIECRNCHYKQAAKDIDYAFRNYEFIWSCPKCNHHGPALPHDHYIKAPRGIRLLRWNPEDVDVRYNDLSGQNQYYYEIPVPLKGDLTMGKKSVVESVPQLFIEAMKQKKAVVFSKDNFFHFKRPSLAGKDRGWGTPLILPVLKDTFYLQVLRKAQESVALEHVLPLRIVFPQAGSTSSDPYSNVNLAEWRDKVALEIRKWRVDCVTPESLIDTADGLRYARDVSEGDLLRNHLGTFSTVEKIWRRPLRSRERAFRIHARGLSCVRSIFSENHPLWAARKGNNGKGHKIGLPEPIYVKDLRPGDYIGYPVTRIVEHRTFLDLANYVDRACTKDWVYVDHADHSTPDAFEYLEQYGPTADRQTLLEEQGWSVDQYKCAQGALREGRTLRRLPRKLPFDAELAWVVGLYLAEGNCSTKQVLFAAHDEDEELIKRLQRFFLERFEATCSVSRKSEHGIQLYFSSLIAAQFFQNLCPGDARTKSIPIVYRQAEHNLVVALLKGMLDGDGCWHEGSNIKRLSYTSVSLQLAEGYRQLALSLGVPVTIVRSAPAPYCICGKRGVSNGVYRIIAAGLSAEYLKSLFAGGPVHYNNSSNSGLFKDGYFWHRIRSIEEVGAKEVIGFQLDHTATVVLPDGSTHGSFCTWGMGSINSNYIPILPLPVGTQTIGGDGRALLLTQELRVWSEQIVAGMGIPNELIFGGMSYSGSNVSLRMLENMFLGYLQDHLALMRWVIRSIADYLGWPMVGARFKPFKMADDLQRKAYLFQLNQAGKLSDESLLADADYDSVKEDRHILNETERRAAAQRKMQIAQAEIQGEAQMVTMRWQMKMQSEQMRLQTSLQLAAAKDQMATQTVAQQYMLQSQTAIQQGQPPPPPPPELTPTPQDMTQLAPPQEVQSPLSLQSAQPILPGATGDSLASQTNVDVLLLARQTADYLRKLDPISKTKAIQYLKESQPAMYETVLNIMGTLPPMESQEQAGRPLPQERAPRRGPQNALI